jgi:hypothetical protein
MLGDVHDHAVIIMVLISPITRMGFDFNSRPRMKGYVTVWLCGLPWVGLMMVHRLMGLVAGVGRDVDTSK